MTSQNGSDTKEEAGVGQGAAELWGKPIHVYTRKQAIEDGELVDVTAAAREVGFRIPVAMTRAAWGDCVEWSEDDNRRKRVGQDETGRLMDVLNMTMYAARRATLEARVIVELYRVPREGRGVMPRRCQLVASCGGGDRGEPVITIMQPNED